MARDRGQKAGRSLTLAFGSVRDDRKEKASGLGGEQCGHSDSLRLRTPFADTSLIEGGGEDFPLGVSRAGEPPCPLMQKMRVIFRAGIAIRRGMRYNRKSVNKRV